MYIKDLWNSTLYKYVYNVVQYTAINYFSLPHCRRRRRRLSSSSQLLRVVCGTYIGVYYTLCVYVYAPAKTVTLRRRHHSHYQDITPSSACALDGFSGGVRQMIRRGNWECQTKSHAKCGGRGRLSSGCRSAAAAAWSITPVECLTPYLA